MPGPETFYSFRFFLPVNRDPKRPQTNVPARQSFVSLLFFFVLKQV